MQAERANAEQLERGVWEAPYRKDGCIILVAVDSHGNERKRVKLLPGVAYARAKAWLEALLDRVDPEPPPRKLELVRDRREAHRPRRTRVLPSADPYDRRAYRNRLIKDAAHRIRVFRD